MENKLVPVIGLILLPIIAMPIFFANYSLDNYGIWGLLFFSTLITILWSKIRLNFSWAKTSLVSLAYLGIGIIITYGLFFVLLFGFSDGSFPN